MKAILSGASTQSTLTLPVLTPRRNSAKSGGTPMRQLTLGFARDGKMKTQIGIVRHLVSKLIGASTFFSRLVTWSRLLLTRGTGRCIRISPAVFTLFDRLNLVFFRRCVMHCKLSVF